MTEPAVTLYQYPRAGRLESLSPFCVKVHLALLYKKIPYRVVDLTTPAQVRRINARGRMPAADVAGERVVDSTEILEAIERTHPEPPLRPAGQLEQARARILEDWADEVLYFYVVYWRWVIEAPRPSQVLKGMPAILRPLIWLYIRRAVRRRLREQGTGLKPIARVQAEITGVLEALTRLLEASPSAFLLGTETPTIADLSVFAQIDGLYWKPLPRACALIESQPRVLEWWRAVNAATRGDAG